jgi:flagellar FliL protein
MAEDKEKDVEKELQLDEASKKKKKLYIIIAAVVIGLILSIVSYRFFFINDTPIIDTQSKSQTSSNLTANNAQNINVDVNVGSALYVPMPRPFRFNVPGAARDRFVEIRVQLMVRGGDNDENAKMHIPLIESTLLGVFSQANADDLATSAGKASLKQKSLMAVQKVMTDIEGNKTIEKVLFTGFVMQ